MNDRTDLVLKLVDSLQGLLVLEQLGTGWPSLAQLEVDGKMVPVALFVSRMTAGHRGRDAVERRFQNPAGNTPLITPDGRAPLLVGISDEPFGAESGRVLAVGDAGLREGRSTRWSLFVKVSSLATAQKTGWSWYESDSHEILRLMHPSLLPLALTPVLDIASSDLAELLPERHAESGSLEAAPAQRLRRKYSQLVRDSMFARRLYEAYGENCLLCGIGLGLVEGAHIYPASAPESSDRVENGLPLCSNHHTAFDRYLLAFDPQSLEVVFRPDIIVAAESDEAVAHFLKMTRPALADLPPLIRPSADLLRRRYRFYRPSYDWLPGPWFLEDDGVKRT